MMSPQVMTFVGYNDSSGFVSQKNKIFALQLEDDLPDIICDVSTCSSCGPLWKIIVEETSFTPAAVPIYRTRERCANITSSEILKDFYECVRGGVRRVTIHPTPDSRLVELATQRIVPTTSRGGSIIINHAMSNSLLGNNYSDILVDIANIAQEFDVTLCIGSVFRGANIFDAMDAVNVAEIHKQIEIANFFKEFHVDVAIEGPGHIGINRIKDFANIISPSGFKVIPLGPVLAEKTYGCDHIVASIGAVLLGMHVDIMDIAAVSPVEHMGGIPSFVDTVTAIKSAKVASHLIAMYKYNDTDDDMLVVEGRLKNSSCMDLGLCSRCGHLCPLSALHSNG